MAYQEHKHQSPKSVCCSIIVTSDTRTEQNDESGEFIMRILKENGHKVLSYSLLKNESEAIEKRVNNLINESKLQVIIISGGTGISSRDVTIETVLPIFNKELDGFGELFRFLTYQQIQTGSIMSRSTAGVVEGKVIICLPGSLNAVSLAMEKIILPEIGHMVREAQR